MSKLCLSSRKQKKSSRWDTTAAARKSMSLHDLTEPPLDSTASFHYNSSLMTLDSIPKSRDSGLSRSASRLSLGSNSGVNLADEPPRSPSKSALKIHRLETEVKRLKRIIREKDLSYKKIFEEKQDILLKFATLQNDVDRYRCQLFSKNSTSQQNLFAKTTRKSFDESSSDRSSFKYDKVWKSSTSDDASQSEQSDIEDISLMSTETTLTPHEQLNSSDDDSTHYVTELHHKKGYEDNESISTESVARSSSISLASNSRIRQLQNSPMQQQRHSPQVPSVQVLSSRREEMCSSPAPSSRWTLDKSFQLVSDSDRSEIDDETPSNETMNTEETMMMSTFKSEETLKADFDELDVSLTERRMPKSASISTINDKHHFINELPEESSTSKIQRWWRDAQKGNAGWKNCKQRPQNLSFNNSPLLQRLKSPQNLSLLSPRPYQVRQNSVPCLITSSGPTFVPPLDLSALYSDTEQSPEEEVSSKQHSVNTSANTATSTNTSKQSSQTYSPSMMDQILWKAQKNLSVSKAIFKSISKGQINPSK